MEDSPPSPPPSTASNILIPSLPDDISLQCIARVPHIHHSNLSLVSKSWNSLFQTPHFFTTRFNLNSTQTLLFIIILQSIGSAFVALDHKIYVIGGSINDIPSPNVWVFDPRLKRWELGPRMRVGREFAAAGVVNGRIYVIGSCLLMGSCFGTTMANVGGNLCVLWERKGMEKKMEIWCAEISIRKSSVSGNELWGSIVWSQVILVVPNGSSVVHCLAADCDINR
ncbi:hypothetical protein MKW94_012715 [Papaver nudicaule]|uniref:F-box domain-containing protein n=1 Tax=Papaver nudicaule TaxID=74823 RepID=A0AA42B0D7_PAPNU|nr:hypothetical protein [Papaver nudicaule]